MSFFKTRAQPQVSAKARSSKKLWLYFVATIEAFVRRPRRRKKIRRKRFKAKVFLLRCKARPGTSRMDPELVMTFLCHGSSQLELSLGTEITGPLFLIASHSPSIIGSFLGSSYFHAKSSVVLKNLIYHGFMYFLFCNYEREIVVLGMA